MLKGDDELSEACWSVFRQEVASLIDGLEARMGRCSGQPLATIDWLENVLRSPDYEGRRLRPLDIVPARGEFGA